MAGVSRHSIRPRVLRRSLEEATVPAPKPVASPRLDSSRESTVLVLGGSGFLGAHVVAAFARWGASVVSAARRPAARPRFASAGAGAIRDVAWEWASDLALGADDSALARLFDEVQPTMLVLCTALARVGDCERRPDLAESLNTLLPERVARLARQRDVRLVHVSTDLVFGLRAPRGERYSEDDPPSPASLYGRTKAEGEERVLAEHPAALVVRIPLLFGDSLGRGLGASDALLAALGRGEVPNLFTDEWRTPLDVGEAAEAMVELSRGSRSGLLHVAGPTRLSRFELGRLVLRAAGRAEGEVRACERAALGLGERPADCCLDARRARALLSIPLSDPAQLLAGRGRAR